MRVGAVALSFPNASLENPQQQLPQSDRELSELLDFSAVSFHPFCNWYKLLWDVSSVFFLNVDVHLDERIYEKIIIKKNSFFRLSREPQQSPPECKNQSERWPAICLVRSKESTTNKTNNPTDTHKVRTSVWETENRKPKTENRKQKTEN
jgi:hypothetical protein